MSTTTNNKVLEKLNGHLIDYTYDGGWRFKVWFENGLASYQFLGAEGENVSNSNSNIPFQAREIRPELYHIMWHETNIGDMVSLVLDLETQRIHSAAIMDYRGETPMTHFEGGSLHSFEKTT